MATEQIQETTFDLTAGDICLDLANTLPRRFTPLPRESLRSYRDLVSWGVAAGVVSDPADLWRGGDRRPDEAADALRRAHGLREAIYRIFSAVAQERAPEEADLTVLNEELSIALARSQIVSVDEGFAWDWRDAEGALDRMLWPVARSAAELLTSDTLVRVRWCGAEDCDWLFADASKNRSRRWCDMSTCGNRAKARQHYQRRRKAAS